MIVSTTPRTMILTHWTSFTSLILWRFKTRAKIHLQQRYLTPKQCFFDLAETRKTETKFRENILSLMMSVLISSDKPNALLCGPAGCGKTKIVEELAYRLKSSENIVPQLKGYRIYALQLSLISGQIQVLWVTLKNKVKMLINYMSDQDEKRILFIDEIHMLFFRKRHIGSSLRS